MATAHDVAATVLGNLGSVTAMKLEKLVYYCQGWHLAREGTLLFPEPIEAWREGPVVPPSTGTTVGSSPCLTGRTGKPPT